MAYAKNHIASACLLSMWCGDDGQLCAVSPPLVESMLKRPEKVAWRRHFWGSHAQVRRVAEEHLSRIENDAAVALRHLGAQWPAERGGREWLALAFLVAVHVWRNPAGQRRLLEVQREALGRMLPTYSAQWRSEQVDRFLMEVTSDGFRAELMLEDLNKLASVIGSMHWQLIEFHDLVLATSDHPVTVVPIMAPGNSVDLRPLPDGPLLECQEIRVALSPRHALLLTWRDEPDGAAPVGGNDQLAAQLNRAVIAQCDSEWFHHPQRRPTTLVPPLLCDRFTCRPVASMLSGYRSEDARQSRRRSDARALVEQLVEDRITDQVRVVAVARRAA